VSPEHAGPDRLREAGRRLGYVSIGLALLESVLAIPSGIVANSIALLGFGLDSLIEIGSSGTVLWQIAGASEEHRERRERISLRVVGGLLLALAAFVAYDSIAGLLRHEVPRRSIFGIAVLVGSLAAMIALRRAKVAVARALGSHAMIADSKQQEFCAYLSAIALVGVSLNAAFGLWWADPAAALVMVPLIVREGAEALAGRACAHD
jgi:divalent metal cation (Fe/Co/Zn/Cd) transporter